MIAKQNGIMNPDAVFLMLDTGNERLAIRSVDIFKDGSTQNISDLYEGAIEITPIPTVEELNSHIWGEDFYASLISRDEFEEIWRYGMSQFRIHFRLQELDDIVPWGQEPDLRLHWFGLTDGLLWIEAGAQTIYEYSEAANVYFGGGAKYNDYQISRFLEDFSQTFRYIGESIPKEWYQIVDGFRNPLGETLEQCYAYYEEQEDVVLERWCDEEYCVFNEWWWNRGFDSGHLIGGPHILCIRCEEKIKIIWESTFQTDNGESIWTAPKGCFEMPYEEFVSAVTAFFHSFFEAMDRQVEKAVAKDWGNVSLDKQRLLEENEERKEGFSQALASLKNTNEKTDWNKLKLLYEKMKKEIPSF